MRYLGGAIAIISLLYTIIAAMQIDYDPILSEDILLASAQKQFVLMVLGFGLFGGLVLMALSRIVEILEDKFGTE
ncbi:hypothetical protein LG275_03975 [Chryseomicrobium palamuruense]